MVLLLVFKLEEILKCGNRKMIKLIMKRAETGEVDMLYTYDVFCRNMAHEVSLEKYYAYHKQPYSKKQTRNVFVLNRFCNPVFQYSTIILYRRILYVLYMFEIPSKYSFFPFIAGSEIRQFAMFSIALVHT